MFRFLLSFIPPKFILKIATLGPLGFWGKAPGTNGTVAGIFLYTIFFAGLPLLPFCILWFLLIQFAILICDQAEQYLGQKDPPCAILDEFVAFPGCFLGLSLSPTHAWKYLILAFILFRFFDILKPLGINRLQSLPGGKGIIYDDVAAALATAVCLHLGTLFFL